MEGAAGAVRGVRAHGGGAGRERDGVGAEVCGQGGVVSGAVVGGGERGCQCAGYVEVCCSFSFSVQEWWRHGRCYE